MAHLSDKPDADRQRMRCQTTDLRLWLALMGGSIAIHLLAVVILLPIASRAAVHKKSLEVSPIDFVELPSTKANAGTKGSSVKGVVKGAIAPVAAQPAVPLLAPVAQDNSGDESNSGDVALEPPVAPSVTPSVMPSVAPTIAPSAEPSTPLTQSPTPTPTASDTPPSLAPVAASPQPTGQQPVSGQAVSEAVPPASIPSSMPASPQIVTERISAAVPDTSAQYSAERQPIPFTLIASLQVVAVPPDQLETPPPDAIAQPTVSSYRFTLNSEDTVCVPESEPTQFAADITLGSQVGVQVATDEWGRVIDTALWEPSQNPLNDQLATCLVKNWNWKFQPAIAQGKPVASKALVIWVKIDRS